MVTIKQVAEEAGVSKSTVSRYISQKGYVSDEAREKIKAAIKTLHYSPNALAQSLKTKRNRLVGLLLPDISNPFFPRLAKGAEEFLKERGYRVMLGSISADQGTEEEYLQILLQNKAAGIITTHDFTLDHPELEIPVVVVDRVDQETEFGVFSDNKSGGELAAAVIAKAGAEKVLLIRGPLDGAENINQRFESSKDYLKRQGIRMVISDSHSFDFELIQEEARSILATHSDVDSIIAPSDIHAIAYIHELLSLGKAIPEDVQIIGYDDILMSQFIYPSLSTIHQSSYQMGYQAAELVYKIANFLPIEEKRIKLPVHYVERETIRRRT
ncbi:LacI family transcriptional regulator [Streptococcus suis]|uniref:substrate-binding domain-containing protein n=1 Tax=Streptococcus suis TaxID=1307 RepID=UPI0014794E62|nr:LacI family transcriptional regulator [Streptococcus suis]MBY5038406.1 LacI family transcriptional regulator [Streptococcus suis]HEM6089059.1 LacI family DNA-binding transcriptional regulator [Streptococcus suis]HEM6111254.1 LacI family DNA-binding transcriptional regulator [Streptococcus suis]HEM6319026.1 LacI family DNA-binding transcriptional regulator [Streptococcus suis]